MPGWIMAAPSSTSPPAQAGSAPEVFDPQRRRLCADDSCVGLVGPDGRCKQCGLAHPEGPPNGAGSAVFASPPALVDDPPPVRHRAAPIDDSEATFDPSRSLCPDGACVGVLGPDRRCSVCGRGPEAVGG
jgi:hypothetical protein